MHWEKYKKMKKLKEQELTCLRAQLSFYDFEHFCSINNKDIKIEFSSHFKNLTYNDLNYGDSREVYNKKEKLICELINSIFKVVKDDYCVITKYNDCWIVNKKKSSKLYRMLKNSNVKIKETVALLVDKNALEIELFIKSVLKYNSFVQFLFSNDKIVMSVTDHMDIFISVCRNDFIQIIKDNINEFNVNYSINESCYPVFNMVTLNMD